MIDFGALWREESTRRRPAPTSEEWDARAHEDAFKYGPGEYSQQFLQLADLRAGESVFDMGCGAGSLAIPCALQGHRVFAADFSPVMLEQCREGLPADAPGTLETKLLAWEDDWDAAGVGARSFDVAFASRSIATSDLQHAVQKLSRVARHKVCVTVVAGKSPRVSRRFFADLGLNYEAHQDAAFTFAIASQLGFEPQVSFIRSSRTDRFASREQAQKAYRVMLEFAQPRLQGESLAQAQQAADEWLDAHLVNDPTDAARPFHVDEPRVFSWAFIWWEV